MYEGLFTGNYVAQYKGLYTHQWTGVYVGLYTGQYSKQFEGSFVDGYAKGWSKQYEGEFAKYASVGRAVISLWVHSATLRMRMSGMLDAAYVDINGGELMALLMVLL